LLAEVDICHNSVFLSFSSESAVLGVVAVKACINAPRRVRSARQP
jgi:hypothetical protein